MTFRAPLPALTRPATSLMVALAVACAAVFTLTSPLAAPLPAHADSAPAVPANPGSPPTVAADRLPTAQIDGVVWAQVVVGNTVYVAGKFTTARPAGSPAGSNTVVRNNLMAYNIETGVIDPAFAPSLNAQALAIAASPDGTKLYVAGDFTTVNGGNYYRMAAFDLPSGALITGFRPILGSQGRALVATNSTVWVGGTFRTVSSQPRDYLAALNGSTGAVTSWVAPADGVVNALALSSNGTLVAGGRFTSLSGRAVRGLAAVSSATGAALPWAASSVVRNAGTNAAVTSLYGDGDRIYGTGYAYGQTGGNLEGTFSADQNGGVIRWLEDCHGDSYSVFPIGDAVYVASHAHYCGNIGGFPQTDPPKRLTAFSKAAVRTVTPDNQGYWNFGGNPAPSLLDFFPTLSAGTFTGQGQAAWSLAGNARYLVAGGEFPAVNGTAQQGLVRFAIPSIAPNKVAPVITTELVPAVTSPAGGQVRVSWRATYDNDNANLTYTLVRDGATATPVLVRSQLSNFYTLPTMTYLDTGVPAGSHSYRLYVTDPFDNSVDRLSATVTVAAGPTGNQPPTASFTTQTTDLTGSFDAGGSRDPDGSIAAYAWEFGDGTFGTGVTASHTFAAAGSYTVRLTVTDNAGSAASATSTVIVPTQAAGQLAADNFDRSVAGGWGSATSGGAWTVAGNAANLSVSGGEGIVSLAGGSTRSMTLGSVSSTSTDVAVSFTLGSSPDGSGSYNTIIGRKTGSSVYIAHVRITSAGAISLVLQRDGTVLSNTPVPGAVYTPGTTLRVRMVTTGVSPTTLRGKVWRSGETEPSAWLSTVTDSTAALQSAGSIGLQSYSGGATTVVVVTRFDDLVAQVAP